MFLISMFTQLVVWLTSRRRRSQRARRRRSVSIGTGAIANQIALYCMLEKRVVCSATPVAAKFNAKNNFGVTRIEVDGQNLLLGTGFSIIGGKEANQDTSANNFSSEDPRNKNGVMYPGGNPSKGSIPYSMTFNAPANDPSKLNFTITAGPSATSVSSISIPLEGQLQLFNYWRSSTSPTVSRYDQNALVPNYGGGQGKYYINFAPGTPQWGEIIGTNYTMRVTISNSSRPMSLGFVNAPGLSTGDRDVEFGFGPVKAGEKVSVSGTIQIFRTDTSLLPSKVYEAEASPYSLVGKNSGDGRVATASQIGFLQYGPYLGVNDFGSVAKDSTKLAAGSHRATFRLLVDNNTANNNRIMTIDVYSGGTIKKLDITRKMFKAANTYQDFALDFDAKPGQSLEFRVYTYGGSLVKLDKVIVI